MQALIAKLREGSASKAEMLEASELILSLYLKTKKPENTQMTELQFMAIARLCKLRPETKTCQAVKAVFTEGISAYQASKNQGCDQQAVNRSCALVRSALRDCYIVITGEEPDAQ